MDITENESLKQADLNQMPVESNAQNESEVSDDNELAAASAAVDSLSKAELVGKLKQILTENSNLARVKADVEAVKQNFYKILNQDKDEEKNKFVNEGGNADEFVPTPDPLEQQLKDLLGEYKKRRQDEIQKEEAERLHNLNLKKEIILKLNNLIESQEDFGGKVPAFQKIQEEWKAVGPVPATDSAKIRENYQSLVESFYDNLKINNELRDYDFRKNLEAKTKLCEEAEKLDQESDVIAAFKTLQSLHEMWSELGPVSKENRELIWNRFKQASTVINKKHNDYFDKLRAAEEDNLVKKTAICEKIEAVKTDGLSTMNEWQAQTDAIIALQQEWRKIGFAPKKQNVAIYERFRAACDKFFNAKSEFLKGLKSVWQANLEKKIALCERAEALQSSTEWKETTNKLVELQKEWKTIGAVPYKQSDSIWKRFNAACDVFFDAKKKLFKDQKREELDNLDKKKEIIEKIQTLQIADDHKAAEAQLRQLINDYAAVGHVPFKEKDNLYKSYRAAIDEKFDALKAAGNAASSSNPKSEKAKLQRQKASLELDIATYENNMGFLKTPGSASLRDSIQNKIDSMKKDLKVINQKLAALAENKD